MKFTVIGASGFIGRALVMDLLRQGVDVWAPARGDGGIFERELGHVVYAAGVTADFRSRPFDTIRANTGLVADILERAHFDSLLYLSSARVYRHADSTREDASIFVRPTDPEDLYDFSKLTAEALCRASGRPSVRVARLSNVVGSDRNSRNFLPELIRRACVDGRIVLATALDSEKDYIALSDVIEQIGNICRSGRFECYNLCSGANLSHRQLVDEIARITGATVVAADDAPRVAHPVIDVSRLREEFSYRPTPVLGLIAALVNDYRNPSNVED